jgi:uncharacterized protein YbbC (DUF1343 family)
MTAFLTKAKILIYAAFLWVSLPASAQVRTGAEHTEDYLPKLKGKRVALVVNQSSLIGRALLPDSLLALHVDVKKIFAPEHGFRGDVEAGGNVKDYTDSKTGLPVISLYGKNKKPQPEQLADIDVVIFDIQDVGVRFYTYISTLHYIMEACAAQHKDLIVLDRPNPNGYYVDGPVLRKEFNSFVGMDPVPLVYGMTIGEYAEMLNGEGWLDGGIKCPLTVIKLSGYTHNTQYVLPVPHSPNLNTMSSVYLYPSVGLFEGTDVSVGRGTDSPFTVIGKPGFPEGDYSFTPKSIPGKAEDPPYKGQLCKGFNLYTFGNDYIKSSGQVYLYWLCGFYKKSADKKKFFTPFFDKLAGTDELRKQIQEGIEPEKIKAGWKTNLDKFLVIRSKYLLYDDFSPRR